MIAPSGWTAQEVHCGCKKKPALAGDTIDIRSCMVLVFASIIMLWDRNRLCQNVHNTHSHELVWRPNFHLDCLAQSANMRKCNPTFQKSMQLAAWHLQKNWLAGVQRLSGALKIKASPIKFGSGEPDNNRSQDPRSSTRGRCACEIIFPKILCTLTQEHVSTVEPSIALKARTSPPRSCS